MQHSYLLMFGLFGFVYLMVGCCHFVQSAEQRLQVVSDTTVTGNAHVFPNGDFGLSINGQTFQQEALVCFNGYQYAAFFSYPGIPSLSRRRLPDGNWQTIVFDDYKIAGHNDAHNVIVVGVSHKDGSIHLAYDHHGSTLHYRKSIAGLASQPDKHEWCASSFGPTTSELESGKPLTGLTYPMFFSRPDGVLQLAYRLGSSGRGDWYLAEFSPDKGAWDTIGKLFSRNGMYQNSTSRCAYPNPFRYDSKNRLHVTWCWRERPVGVPFNLTTNHDICYAYSDDFGRTWHNNAGDRIADISANPIGIDTLGIIVAPTRYLHGQMNQVSQFVDNENRVHAMSWHRSGKESKASTDVNTWKYFHVWKAKGDEWHMDELPFKGRKPQIITDSTGMAYIIYTKGENSDYHGTETGGKLTISASTEESKWMEWTTVWQSDWTGIGEPLLDIGRWQSDGVLSIYLQQKPDKNGDPCKLHVVDLLRK